MNKPFIVLGLTAVVAATILVGSSRSQQAATDPAVPVKIPSTEILSDPTGTYGRATAQYKAATDRYDANRRDALTESRAAVDKVVQQLRAADSESKKAEFTKHLETAVGAYFDEDVKVRESEITKLEERLAKLRAQLDRRRKAKTEITQLQTKVLVNDAEGLGFSDAWSTGTTTPQPSMMWQKANTFPAK